MNDNLEFDFDFSCDVDGDVFDIDGGDDDIFPDGLDYGVNEPIEKRYINPGKAKISKNRVVFKHAIDLAQDIGVIEPGERRFCLLNGNFIFGDFIEAWLVTNRWQAENVTISTLSMSYNNVDSFHTLLAKNYVKTLDILISDYYYAHQKNELIRYMYHRIDIDNRFQLAVARVHTKITLIKLLSGQKIVIHGSANLRTSQNVEQIMIESDEALYDFMYEWHHKIIAEKATINKEVAKDG